MSAPNTDVTALAIGELFVDDTCQRPLGPKLIAAAGMAQYNCLPDRRIPVSARTFRRPSRNAHLGATRTVAA